MKISTTMERLDWDRWLPAILVFTGFAQAILQITYFTEIRYDDAQLIEWAARPQFGNLDQPSLLSNIAWMFSKAGLPPDQFIKIARQVFIVAAIIVFRVAFGYWTQDRTVAWLGAIAITLIDDVRGKAVTEFTHFTFVIFSLSVLFMVTTLILKNKSVLIYVLFGLSAALVFHSKYNGTLYVIIVLAMCLYDASARKILMDRRALISAALFLALAAPAVVWGYLNQDAVRGTFGKYKFNAEHSSPFVEAIDAYTSSLTSVAIFVMLALAPRLVTRDFRIELSDVARDKFAFLGKYCLTFFLGTIIVAMAMDVGDVARRWVIPGTLFMAMYGGLLAAQVVSPRARSIWLTLMVVYWVGVNVWVFLR